MDFSEWQFYFERPVFEIKKAFVGKFDEFLLSNVTFLSGDNISELNQCDVAIIGLGDYHKNSAVECYAVPNLVRSFLYGLKRSKQIKPIYDLGNLKGKSIDDRYKALQDFVELLSDMGVLPIVVGGTQDYTLPLVKAVASKNQNYRVSFVDSRIDLSEEKLACDPFNYINVINDLESVPEDITFVATQGYQVSSFQMEWVQSSSNAMLRLGEIRKDGIIQAEPWLRDVDVVSVDASVLMQCADSSTVYPRPNGLSGEEFCQLMWYAGLSDLLKNVGFFQIDNQGDGGFCEKMLIAQGVWHTIEGNSLRFKDYPVRNVNEHKQFIVYIDECDLSIKFYTNAKNERWWMEAPLGDSEQRIIACSKMDFIAASKGEIPDRWLRFVKKN